MAGVRVVGAAVLRTDAAGRRTVLAAQRREPPRMAGLWEFPGGKVEPGEDDVQALERELAEELGVRAEVGGRVGPEVPLGGPGHGHDGVLVVHLATICGEPRLLEHDAHRWLAAAELDDVPWIPLDRPILDALRPLLS